jgi:Flp pilus assembly protein TadD
MLEVEEARRAADRAPDDLDAQLAAAYACDRIGLEDTAVTYYDAAWSLAARIPKEARRDFLVGYGSTLRNVGRLEDSLAVLRVAAAEHPGDAAVRAFLALSLLDSGAAAQAVGTLLDVALEFADVSPDLGRFRRALAEYRDQLLARP